MAENVLKARVAERLAALFGWRDAVLVGRARSGLLALLMALRRRGYQRLLCPANICPSIAVVSHAAGMPLHIVASEDASAMPNDERIAARLTALRGPGIVMPVHAFGFVASLDRTRAAATQHGWFVIENDTAAVTAVASVSGSRPRADALLTSFGSGKVLGAGVGGAVLTDHPEISAALRTEIADWPSLDGRAAAVEAYFIAVRRQLWYGHPERRPLLHACEALLNAEASDLRYAMPDASLEALSSALDLFSDRVMRRRERAERWHANLARVGSEILIPTGEQRVPWRFLAFLPRGRDRVIAALLAAGAPVGALYPPLTAYYPEMLRADHEEGQGKWAAEAINFWVDPDIPLERIDHWATLVERALRPD